VQRYGRVSATRHEKSPDRVGKNRTTTAGLPGPEDKERARTTKKGRGDTGTSLGGGGRGKPCGPRPQPRRCKNPGSTEQGQRKRKKGERTKKGRRVYKTIKEKDEKETPCNANKPGSRNGLAEDRPGARSETRLQNKESVLRVANRKKGLQGGEPKHSPNALGRRGKRKKGPVQRKTVGVSKKNPGGGRERKKGVFKRQGQGRGRGRRRMSYRTKGGSGRTFGKRRWWGIGQQENWRGTTRFTGGGVWPSVGGGRRGETSGCINGWAIDVIRGKA